MDDLNDCNFVDIQWEYDFDFDDNISDDDNDDWVSSVYDYKLVNKNMKEFYLNQLNKEKHTLIELKKQSFLNNQIKEFDDIKQLIVDPVLVSMLDNDNHITIIKLPNGKFDQILESNIK
jgi:hypothetical protein